MNPKPWLKHYDKGVPHTLRPYPRCTLLDIVSNTARQRPNHPAMLFKGGSISYAELERLSNALATGLVNIGVHKGDRVALLLPNSPQTIVGELGIWKAGGITVPMNPMYTEDELEFALNECGAKAVLVLTPFYQKIKSIQPRTQVERIIATNIKEYLPPFKRLLFTLLKEKKEGHRVALRAGDKWFGNLLSEYANLPKPQITVNPEDPAILLFTGGTTGAPKCATGTHHALLMAAMQLNSWFGVVLKEWEDRIMLNMPLFHVYGQVGTMATGIIGHYPMVLIPNPRDIDDVLNTIKEVKPALLPGVPTLFIALSKHPKAQVSLRSLKLCVSGGAPLLLETKQRFEALTGGRIIEAYALTESMIAAVCTPILGTYKRGAVGIPAPDVELRIVDAETGEEELASNEIGEILVSAPQLMAGYWQNPNETAHTIRDGWLYTGDLGYLDDDGYLFIVDRKKDLIKPSGFQVWPREVEEVIAAHPAVAEVGVAGIPDAYQGEAVKAWVVLQAGQRITSDELRDYCRKKLAAYKVPKYIEFRESLPKTTVGKILRRELASEQASNLVAQPFVTADVVTTQGR
ncbi:MAG TPA: long-chain fatty acid--CoA ligase [Anaerolineales bacterium]|nr:long-chain fatty acid--CoA ligase [Anaerolineales bacterium]